MLQLLRDKAQSTFIQIIVVIIALVFIFWGVGTNMMGSRQAALVVNGEEISFEQFQQTYDRVYQRLSDQFGGNVPKGLVETLGIKQQAINQLVQATLLRQGAEKMGIVVSREEIRKVIQNMVQFQENGVFSLERYKAILAQNRLNPTKFEASMQHDRLAETASRKISNFATVATDYEIRDLFNQINEKIALDYVKISPSRFSDKVEINDSILADWFQKVKDNYKTEPQLKLKYLAFTYDAVGKKIEIDPAEIESYYNSNKKLFTVKEQRHARHILFKAEKDAPEAIRKEKETTAAEVLKLARGGRDFVELAKEYSEGPSRESGGDLGFFEKGSMVIPFDTAVFAMQPGDISDVIKTRYGYHIIKLEEVKPASVKPLTEVKEKIVQILQRKKAEEIAFQVANTAYEGIISAGSLKKYTEKYPDTKVIETDFFTRSDPPQILADDPQFLSKCFELNRGELSSLIKGQSGYGIFFAEDLKNPEIPSLEKVRERVLADYKKEKSMELAEKSAAEILAQLRAGKDFAVVAPEHGFELLQTGFLSKREKNGKSDFPGELLAKVFLLSPSSPLPEKPEKVNNELYVFRYLDSKVPEMTEASEEVAKLKNDLLRFKQQQLLSAWLMHQEKTAKITKHKSL
ncbi:peptidylprolyl isomerase [Desulfomarina profundi]|uniref:Peptidylprolyl isomerase n=1 Tax=Desulfomarina profundi TaxID=2772557 RepID=A0A8D5FN27_9BACT|nr:SurA N-terminal domain-containing protein [Desulfomarina profundi]BCL62123.1 peptidylprolyl isomerase [Desulfomarina profundi]